MYCSRCGSAHRPDAVFCSNCGARLDCVQEPPAVAQPETVFADFVPQPEPMIVTVNSPVSAPAPLPRQPWGPAFTPFPPPAGSQPVTQAPPQPAEPQTGKGRHWPALLAMGILTALGLLLFFLLPNGSDAPAAPKSCFTVNDGLLSFHAEYYTGGSSLTVPEEVEGQKVTGLAKSCFADCDTLEEIILPDGLTYIGDFAFAGCDSLRGIFIPERVSYLGKGVFENCTQLEAVCVPGSVGMMGTGAFGGCEELRHVFYSGEFEAWQALYSEYINGSVTVYAEDGAFPHDD